ncbi:drug resistance transporter, EmrB/QacA subfamily [Luteibacter sp. UNCMF331Sha3.1]|uniref:DHA2 family efflux MFS transporter permease subunit n=1 Tax=Luteibacter sp. UNCMF331Sha3.1 TaxID=1502760 RepID=UPI0008C04603|nr:DHA2 family efflux MFS transporter permease subunit [Luteibacter sp. UNCMF331Sha3.1]SEN11684.1 drug resistance transporter, EmrB/QacA subfamily [Luteibacter sp. UNCMF331Sha3.1]
MNAMAHLSQKQKLFAFATMCVGMFIALLDIQIVAASLRDIGGGLSAGADDTAWVQTSYLIAEIVVIPLSGWLSRVLSTRWLFAISAAGFTLTSLLCGLAWDIQSMIVFRAAQGFLGGSMIPLVFTTVFVFFEGKQRVVAAATIGALASLAPTIGPALGGWITDNFSWHWLFFINLIPGVFVTVVVPMLVKIDEPDFSLLKTGDWAGIALIAMFLGCLEYTLEEGPRWNWLEDDVIRTTFYITVVSGVLFVWRGLTAAHPVVDLRALKDRNFLLGCIFSFVTGIGLFGTIYLTPLFLGRVEGYSALQIGQAVFSTGIFQILSIPVYAILANRVDLRWLLMFGLALFAISMFEFTPITHDWSGTELLFPQALRGIAQQMSVPPVVTLTLGALPPSRLKQASGLFNLMRNLGGAMGIAGCATVLNDRTNLHFLRLAEHLNPTNEAMNNFLSGIDQGAETSTMALRSLWQLTYREAQTMTYSDAFFSIMVCFVIATVLVPLMRKVAAPTGPSADAH